MDKRLKLTLGILGLVLIIAVAMFAYGILSENMPGEQGETATPKTKASDFTVYDADGNPIKLSDMLGRPVILNFWASWCGPCRSEMPLINDIYKEFGNDVVFLMINLTDGQRETIETAQSYVTGEGYTFPICFDTTGEAGNIYGVRYIPTTYFIDREGNITGGKQGPINETEIRAGIEKILQQ